MNYILSLFLLVATQSLAQSDTLRIFYNTNEWQLNENQRVQIAQLKNQKFVIEQVEAHCDERATSLYNDQLAQRRMNEVLRVIGKQNPSIEATVFGESKAGKSGKGLDYDRRVEIVYSKRAQIIEIEHEEVQPIVVGIDQEVDPEQANLENFLTNEDEEEVVIQLSILFYNSSGQYLPESEPEMKALYKLMRDNPNVNAHIRGHICCHPYSEYDDISQARAATVAFYLVDRGIARERITFKGYGTSIPFRSPEMTEEDQRLNRRVDVVFTKE